MRFVDGMTSLRGLYGGQSLWLLLGCYAVHREEEVRRQTVGLRINLLLISTGVTIVVNRNCHRRQRKNRIGTFPTTVSLERNGEKVHSLCSEMRFLCADLVRENPTWVHISMLKVRVTLIIAIIAISDMNRIIPKCWGV
jgi:hypothetical protein